MDFTIYITTKKIVFAIISSLTISMVPLSIGMAQNLENADFRFWSDVTFRSHFSAKWNLNSEIGVRGLISTRDWTTLTARPTFIYRLNRLFEARGGAGVFYTMFQESNVNNLTELRFHQEARVRWPQVNGFDFNHMFRFEERFFYLRGAENRFSARFRYRLTMTTPDFTVFKMERPFYVLVSGDFFFPVAGVLNNFFSNNYRLILGLGNRHSKKMRYEVQYFWQRSRINVSESFQLSDHILRLRFFIELTKNK